MIKTRLSATTIALLLLGITGCQTASTVPQTKVEQAKPTSQMDDKSTNLQTPTTLPTQASVSTQANVPTQTNVTTQAKEPQSETSSTKPSVTKSSSAIRTKKDTVVKNTTISKATSKSIKTKVKTQSKTTKTTDKTKAKAVKSQTTKKITPTKSTVKVSSTSAPKKAQTKTSAVTMIAEEKTAPEAPPSTQIEPSREKPIPTENKNPATSSTNDNQESTDTETVSAAPQLQSTEEEKQESADTLSEEQKTNPESTLAMITPLPSPAKALELEELPLTFNLWTLDLAQTPSASECILRSRPVSMEDGQGSTTLTAQITDNAVIFKTRSMIDTSYENTGIQIDQGRQIPLEKLHTEESVIYSSGYGDVMDLMEQGKTLTVSLGFWPTWPVTQAYEAKIDLTNFDQALQSLKQCSLLLR